MKERASNLVRRRLCPGSASAESGLPEVENEDANEGKLLHHAWLFGPLENRVLSDEQASAVERVRNMEDDLVEQVFGKHPGAFLRLRELLLESDSLNLSGHPDSVWICDKTALIIDAKYGRLPVEHAEANMQLRAYSVLLCEKYALERVFCAIIQPRIERERQITLCEYDAVDLIQSRKHIGGILAVAGENAPRIPSIDACRYCKASGTERCPESLIVVERACASIAPIPSAADLEACVMAKNVIDAVQERAKAALIADANAIPGWALKEGANRRVIEDATKAYANVSGAMEPEEFASCCKVNVKQLETMLGKKIGLKGKALKETFEMDMGDALTYKKSEPSLTRITP